MSINALESVISPTLLTGLSSDQVLDLQKHLKLLGYELEADGKLGKFTVNAFADWKGQNFLNNPNMIGPSSILKLIKEVNRLPCEPIDWTDIECKISEFFTVGEVCQYSEDRIPSSELVKNRAIALAKELDQVRKSWGKPILVTSWYRPPAINKAVGGVPNSQHLTGAAADIFTTTNIVEFQDWLDKNWTKALGYGAKKGFVHLDLRPVRLRWNY